LAPALEGTFSPDAALSRVLDKSGLESYRINERTIGIRIVSGQLTEVAASPV